MWGRLLGVTLAMFRQTQQPLGAGFQSITQEILKEYQSARFLVHRLICCSLRNGNCFVEYEIL